MAIQQIDLAVPNGDTVRSANVKINQNFSNTDHAASKLVGVSNGQIPLSQDVFKASNQKLDVYSTGADLDTLQKGERRMVLNGLNSAPDLGSIQVVEVHTHHATINVLRQNAYKYKTGEMSTRVFDNTWSDWRPASAHPSNYAQTTGTAPNVVVDIDGVLKRSTSSEKYKDIIAPLELDEEKYKQALAVKPIIYRSKCEADPSTWHYMSFSAEELGAYDPCLTQWKTHETDPETGERVELEQKEAEGINLNAICAVLHATNIKQAELIDDLKARVEALEKGV